MATVEASKSHVFGMLSLSEQSKSGLRNSLRELKRILDHLLRDHEVSVDIEHVYNEHGRDASDIGRDTVSCYV
jgi:hypothetical protein